MFRIERQKRKFQQKKVGRSNDKKWQMVSSAIFLDDNPKDFKVMFSDITP
jgi:hypothetical protein